MAPDRRIRIIANPTSGKGRSQRTARAVAANLRARGIDAEITYTQQPGDAERSTEQLCSSAETRPGCIVACGGDGTVQEISNALAKLKDSLDSACPAMGIAPSGRCNDFARALRLSRDPAIIAETLATGKRQATDLGCVNGRCFCTVATVGADADVTLDLGNRVVSFLRGRSPDVMVRSDGSGDQAVVSVLLRRVKGKTTQGALRGAWHGLVLEYSGAAGTTGGLQITTAGRRFELDVQPAGRAVASDSDLWTTRLAYPGGNPTTDRDRKAPKPGTLRPSGSFARLTMDVGVADGPAFVDLHPVARGDVLVGLAGDFVGTPNDPESAMSRLVILVRAGAKGGNDDLDGRSRFVALDTGFESAAVGAAVVPTFELLNLDVQHDGDGSLRARGGAALLRHGPDGQPSITGRQIDVTGTYRIEKDLIYRESQPVGPGALLRRRGLYITTRFGDDRSAIGFGLPARPAAD